MVVLNMLYYRDKHQQQLKFYLLPGSSFKECFIELVYTSVYFSPLQARLLYLEGTRERV